MLLSQDWSQRMAIPEPWIKAAAPDSFAFMAALTMWRWNIPLDRALWNIKVDQAWMAAAPPMVWHGPGQSDKRQFWAELRHKKYHLYGSGVGVDADPLALVRHPWTLLEGEFQDAYQKITKREMPGGPNDDRRRYGNLAALVVAGPAAGGLIAGLLSMPITAGAIGLAGVGIGAAAAINDVSMDSAHDRQLAQIRGNFDGYVSIYQKELAFRQREAASS